MRWLLLAATAVCPALHPSLLALQPALPCTNACLVARCCCCRLGRGEESTSSYTSLLQLDLDDASTASGAVLCLCCAVLCWAVLGWRCTAMPCCTALCSAGLAVCGAALGWLGLGQREDASTA